ncbi:hypothetical protein HHK36_030142 [Tetracentron sinense]|uniref:Uncharacterized protein n=1 Tax=Tetracentron sinense TaxID=13715 RepID=A0A835D104_TETSI|nr:hypothetical protein HHK36_031851 [Tetracentron sinense]KAF8378793.1 hypothetical protein HHK36_030142 [Tetracentron sinense]
MGTLHALAISYPAQGHVMPLKKLSYCLAERGLQITFVNSEFIHEHVMTALPEDSNIKNQIHLVSIPDGMGAGEDRNQHTKLLECSKGHQEAGNPSSSLLPHQCMLPIPDRSHSRAD